MEGEGNNRNNRITELRHRILYLETQILALLRSLVLLVEHQHQPEFWQEDTLGYLWRTSTLVTTLVNELVELRREFNSLGPH